ncbi:hypothetical protein C9374_001958 [Naegleria lovaniensis]|uniref:GOST seven transmembrane domain-containing protein n=1 Tax=Naegleria lovaniensis TaxID=51637 RepID=A0AA88GW27_NAELO|nr:uncharacterized protein C9374_001958 [Naegleria lovaniensis]KAG2386923.1 hypothetical protein C9374_001958 [Naegleria lovaniensis]
MHYGSFIVKRLGIATEKYAFSSLAVFSKLKKPSLTVDLSIQHEQNVETKMYWMLIHSDDLETFYKNTSASSHNYYSLGVVLDQICDSTTYIPERSHFTEFTTRIHAKYEDFTKSGIYYAIILNCDTDSNTKSMTIKSGSIKYVNPFGHLSAEVYDNLPFYGFMSIVVFVIGMIYMLSVFGVGFECQRPFGIQFIKKLIMAFNRKKDEAPAASTLPEQQQKKPKVKSYAIIVWIFVVLILFLLENSFSFAMLQHMDVYGRNNNFLFTISSLFHMCRKLFSRIFIILLCVGYGSIRDYLGGVKSFLLWTYGLAYCLAVVAYEIVDLLFVKVHVMSPIVASLLSTPVVVLDVIAFIWILAELTSLMRQLKKKNQSDRWRIFALLTSIIIAYLIVTLAWLIYTQILLDNSDQFKFDKRWETNWTIESVWSIIFLVVMSAIMIVFRKSNLAQLQQHIEKKNPLKDTLKYHKTMKHMMTRRVFMKNWRMKKNWMKSSMKNPQQWKVALPLKVTASGLDLVLISVTRKMRKIQKPWSKLTNANTRPQVLVVGLNSSLVNHLS